MDDEDKKTIWCGNLSENVTEEILYELFLQAGPLQSVRIPKTRDGNRRSYGFVTYKHECSVPYALALFEGTELYRRELKLQSRNPDRIKLDPRKFSQGSENFHNRSKSLPIQFEAPTLNLPRNPMHFNNLLFLGQNLMMPSDNYPGTSPYGQANMYASQLGASQYLGGDLSTRSLQGGWSNRNHPYSHRNGSSKHYSHHKR